MLSRGNFHAENSIVTKFCHLALGGPIVMPHRVDIATSIQPGCPNVIKMNTLVHFTQLTK